MSIIDELARNILKISFEDFDPPTITRARARIIDTVGCIIAGANADGCSIVRDLIQDWGGKKEGTILVHGGKVPAHNAAMMNCVMARSYDFEPVGPFVDGKNAPGHVSGTTVPTALTSAEQRGMSGKDLLTALILGDDLASRINAASVFTLDSGWDCVGTANMFGATAIAGKLAGLNEEQLVNAFGIVLNQLSGTMQTFFDGVHAFKLVQGLAARAAIFSVALADKGFKGVRDPLFSKYGYFALYCKAHNADVLTKDLGRAFYADNTIKPYPCCRANHASIDCALELVRKENVVPEEIEQIVVEVPAAEYNFAVGQPFRIRDIPQIDAAFSLQYCIADAFLRGTVRLEHFSEEAIREPRVMEMIDRVRLTKSADPDKFLASRILLKTTKGDTYASEVGVPKGDDTFTPLSVDERKEKFMSSVAFSKTVPLDKAKKAFGLLERLEEVDDVTKIVKSLVT
jgi:2-methylcitrate dehydratase PrpD